MRTGSGKREEENNKELLVVHIFLLIDVLKSGQIICRNGLVVNRRT